MNIKDIEKTQPETRAAHAELWNQDWYKVVEDMKHCAMFCMIEELTDLLTDGLEIVGGNTGVLSDTDRAEWQSIIADVKACPMGHDAVGATRIMFHLSRQCKRMMALMERIA
jgi:hypothetical protein